MWDAISFLESDGVQYNATSDSRILIPVPSQEEYFLSLLFASLSLLCLCSAVFFRQPNLNSAYLVQESFINMQAVVVKPTKNAQGKEVKRPYVRPSIKDLGKVDEKTEYTTPSGTTYST
ncbi:MAG: hypothetical protein GYA55_13005 [SAR324 cluster bacterium]|uniref:Uncharacterized protein n=1 Tax=SAR324 cluster bacterium TaxID=2024889 RepID=A0A7X9IKU8_9DELT|nr:hypothetical protein [SAR324 cluster bacterium]